MRIGIEVRNRRSAELKSVQLIRGLTLLVLWDIIADFSNCLGDGGPGERLSICGRSTSIIFAVVSC